MHLSPQPRFRFYGSPQNCISILVDMLTGNLRRAESDVRSLETRIAERTAAKHGLGLPRARLGIYLAIKHLIQPGQNVILSPYTIHDVINMVICAGGRPVFADIDPATCNIDPAQVAGLLDGNTGAVIVTHLHGLSCDMRALTTLCSANRVPIIEDAAQCFGGRYESRPIGAIGDVGIFSFSVKKNVNALFGGALVTNDGVLYQRIVDELASFEPEDTGPLLRQAVKCLLGDLTTAPLVFQGLTFPVLQYDTKNGGRLANRLMSSEKAPTLHTALPESYKRRLTAAQARAVIRQLDRVEADMQTRIAYARIYQEGLSDLLDVGLPPMREDGSHTYLDFPIRVPERQALLKHLARKGRDVREQWYTNTADLQCFSQYARECPNARTTAQQVVLLPTYPSYGESEVRKNVAAIRDYYRSRDAVVPRPLQR